MESSNGCGKATDSLPLSIVVGGPAKSPCIVFEEIEGIVDVSLSLIFNKSDGVKVVVVSFSWLIMRDTRCFKLEMSVLRFSTVSLVVFKFSTTFLLLMVDSLVSCSFSCSFSLSRGKGGVGGMSAFFVDVE